MKLINKITFGLASLFLLLAINQTRVTSVLADDCVVNYGGTVCAAHTPVATDIDSESLYSIAGVLYSTGLASFIISKRV